MAILLLVPAERVSLYLAGAPQNRVTAVTVGPPGETG